MAKVAIENQYIKAPFRFQGELDYRLSIGILGFFMVIRCVHIFQRHRLTPGPQRRCRRRPRPRSSRNRPLRECYRVLQIHRYLLDSAWERIVNPTSSFYTQSRPCPRTIEVFTGVASIFLQSQFGVPKMSSSPCVPQMMLDGPHGQSKGSTRPPHVSHATGGS